MQAGNILVIVAMIVFVIVAIVGTQTPNTWKWVGITWGLLVLGLIFFATAMTIS